MTTVKEMGFVSCPVVMSLDYTSQFDKKLTNGSHWVGLESIPYNRGFILKRLYHNLNFVKSH